MKTIRVVAAIILDDDKVFALSGDMVSLRMDGNFQVVR